MALRTLKSVASFCVVTSVIRSNIVDVEMIHGASMQPTFNDKSNYSWILVDKLSPRLNRIKLGDVIIAKQPQDSRYCICKRVSGMPTNEIRYYYKGRYKTEHLAKGHVWLLGDNAQQSKDSRSFGQVPYNLIVSKVLLLLYPRSSPFFVKSQLHHNVVVNENSDKN